MRSLSRTAKSLAKLPVLIFHDCKSLPCPEKAMISVAKRIYKNEKLPLEKKTHVILYSNRKIKKLNAMFLNRNRATDVMSFNYDENDLFGEIYISLQRAKTQAKEYRVAYNNEVLRLFVHGMFHLLGYDHEIEKDRIKMQRRESRYVE